MHCECGFTQQGSAKFCPECGKKVLAPAAQDIQTIPCPNTVQDGRRTPVCGTIIQSSNKFCMECGWQISPQAFLPGAAMCDGNKSSGELCDNIVTPNVKFCSECGNPPKAGLVQETNLTAPAVVEKTVLNKSSELKEDLDNGNKNQSARADKTQDHTIDDMDFEVVSVSSSEGEIVKRSRSYEEAINLENSSDFCNGQFANITTELDSSSLDSELQQNGENSGIQEMMDSMEIVEHPSDGSVKPVLLEEGENGNGKNEKQTKSQVKALDIPKDYTGTGDVISSTSEVDVSQHIIHETGDAPSGTRSSKSLSTEDVEKPPDTPGQNKGKDDEIQDISSQNEVTEDETQDSGTPSTENTVYKPSWSQNSGQERQVNEGTMKLDERKRKSPEKENLDKSKKQHLSEDQSKGDETKRKDDVKVPAEEMDEDSFLNVEDNEGEDEEDQGEDEEGGVEKELGEDSESDEVEKTENADKDGAKPKKHKKTRKKKKQEYLRRKNQLPVKPADNKTALFQSAENENMKDSETINEDEKEQEKERKCDQTRKLRSQKYKENDAASIGTTDPEGNNEASNKETFHPSSSHSMEVNNQNSAKTQPGKIEIPVQHDDKIKNANREEARLDAKNQTTAAVLPEGRTTRSGMTLMEVNFFAIASPNS